MTTVWPVSYASTTTTYTCDVWLDWTTSGATTPTYYRQRTQDAWSAWQVNPQFRWITGQRREMTAAERAKEAWWKRHHAIVAHNRARAQSMRRRIAARRAEALLLEHLDDDQRAEWAARGGFTVHTAAGTEYFIRRGRAGNVYRVGGPRYCMHVEEFVPDADNVLAQKLLLETNEQEFLRLANVA